MIAANHTLCVVGQVVAGRWSSPAGDVDALAAGVDLFLDWPRDSAYGCTARGRRTGAAGSRGDGHFGTGAVPADAAAVTEATVDAGGAAAVSIRPEDAVLGEIEADRGGTATITVRLGDAVALRLEPVEEGAS
jgi:hypothetical protein